MEIRYIIKFFYDSKVTISRSSTLLLEGKTNKPLPLTGVYFILRQVTNIISLG